MKKEEAKKYQAAVALLKNLASQSNLVPFKVKEIEKQIAKDFQLAGFIERPFLRKVYLKLVENKEIEPKKELEKFLQKRKIRSLSGIVCITVSTKPASCPGTCIFCPTQNNIPKSYLLKEPAILRAVNCGYDPFLQTQNRLRSLFLQGHPTDKCEIVIIGGTFSALPKTYREFFVKRIYDALNNKESKNLEEAKKLNENAENRCVGLTIETRPDYIDKEEILFLRKLGVTHVEIGVQSVFDDVLAKNKRGHGVEEIIKATQLLKDAGFKVCYHLMPNLYGSNLERDLEMFKMVFQDSRFKPDYLKIYPCCVIEGTELFELWQQGKYIPYTLEELKNLIKEIKKQVPLWVRIKRLIRDIPPEYIVAGNKVTNLRQIVLEEKYQCSCIRCREIKDREIDFTPRFFKEEYLASFGKEYFLSFEDENQKKLLSFLRLRIPSQVFSGSSHFIKELEGAAIIRELHTYGAVVELGAHDFSKIQHRGFGRKLLEEAEKIAFKEYGLKKIAVIAAVGTRKYYEKFGYRQVGEYMIKTS